MLGLPAHLRERRELAPLLYGKLAAHDRLDALSPEARTIGKRAYLGSLARNLRILGRAQEILDGAEAAGLPILPYKGVLFAEALYGDPALRPMVDLDLLVRPADVDRAGTLMRALGFRRTFADQPRFSPHHAHDVSFTDEHDADLVVEVHYRLYHELGADATVEPLFERATSTILFGRPRRVPAWDDHLLAVAVHAATHAFGDQPMWPFDVALLLARSGGFERALDEAGRRRAGAPFRAALRLAARLLPSLVAAPPARPGDRVRDLLLAQILGPDPLAAPPERVRSLLARAVLTERPRDAAREVVRKAGLRAEEAAAWLRGRAAPRPE